MDCYQRLDRDRPMLQQRDAVGVRGLVDEISIELIDCPGFVGAGVGADDDDQGMPIVVVLVRAEEFLPSGARSIAGVPLRFRVSGEFRALPGHRAR